MPISLRPAANTVIYFHSLAQYTNVYSDKECHDAGMMRGASRSQETNDGARRRRRPLNITCEVRVLQRSRDSVGVRSSADTTEDSYALQQA